MGAVDVLFGSERLLWRLRHGPLDTGLLALLAFGTFLICATMISSAGPVVAVVNQDQGPLGRQVAQILLQSNRFISSTASGTDLDQQVRDGNLDGYILFPALFSRAAIDGQTLQPEIRLASAPAATGQTLLGDFSRALLSASGTTGARLQPQIAIIGLSSASPRDYAVVGAMAACLFGFALLLPFTVSEAPRARQPFLITLGSAIACLLISLLAALLLYVLYLVMGFHRASPSSLVILVDLLGVAAATTLGVIMAGAPLDRRRLTWIVAGVFTALLLFSGLLIPLNAEPAGAGAVLRLLPLAATVDALRGVLLRGTDLGSASLQRDLATLIGFVVLTLGVLYATAQRNAPRSSGGISHSS